MCQIIIVRLCSFGSLVLWISLRLPSDLLYRSNCHVEKSFWLGNLALAQLSIAVNSHRGKRFTYIILEHSQINGKRVLHCGCIAIFHSLVFSARQENNGTELHIHTMTTVCLWDSTHQSIMNMNTGNNLTSMQNWNQLQNLHCQLYIIPYTKQPYLVTLGRRRSKLWVERTHSYSTYIIVSHPPLYLTVMYQQMNWELFSS